LNYALTVQRGINGRYHTIDVQAAPEKLVDCLCLHARLFNHLRVENSQNLEVWLPAQPAVHRVELLLKDPREPLGRKGGAALTVPLEHPML
jgi:hypothetical protein